MKDTKQFNPPPLNEKVRDYSRKLRGAETDAEKRLWYFIRGKQLDARFRRQHPFAGFVLDFYCVELKLAIELDGGQHNAPNALTKDDARTRALEKYGLHVLRFWNDEVFQNTDGVLMRIALEIDRLRSNIRTQQPPL
jgi:very-short-patch-repair endonuclease